MGRSQREKGARGEREVRDILVAGGFVARRDGRLDDDLDHSVAGWHFEVKRREQYDIGTWIKQAWEDADGREPVVVFRKSNEPWRAVIDFHVLVRLLGLEADAREFLREFTNHPEGDTDDEAEGRDDPQGAVSFLGEGTA
jgi:hypothetical protein